MGVTAADFDGDGYPDIYVANDKTENFLFHNQHDGTFKEIALAAGVAFGQNGENTSAMGPVFFDIDITAGTLDLWVTDSKYNRLLEEFGQAAVYRCHPAGRHLAAGRAIHQLGHGRLTISTTTGWKDILIVHGGLIHMVPQEHSVFRNLGGGKFEDVSAGGRTVLRHQERGARRVLRRLRQRRQGGRLLVNLGAPGVLLHNTSPVDGALAHGQTGRAPRATATASARRWRCRRAD